VFKDERRRHCPQENTKGVSFIAKGLRSKPWKKGGN